MSTSTNGNGNLVDEFEEAFQACIHTLTKEDPAMGVGKDEIALEVDQTTSKFVDLARQMETFFVQKRFLLSALRPELVLREENADLRIEITRKEELIKKHYDQIDKWKALLKNQQQLDMRNVPANIVGGGGVGGGPIMQPHQAPMLPDRHLIGGPNAIQVGNAQLQQQQQQQLQAQQHQMMAAQQMQHMQQMVSPQQMFMQQQQGGQGPVMARGGGSGGGSGGPSSVVGGGGGGGGPSAGAVGGFNQGQNVLQGPLAYLEKTTSNIDLVGLGDGRR